MTVARRADVPCCEIIGSIESTARTDNWRRSISSSVCCWTTIHTQLLNLLQYLRIHRTHWRLYNNNDDSIIFDIFITLSGVTTGGQTGAVVRIRKLEWLPFYVISNNRQKVLLFRHKAHLWQTERWQNYDSQDCADMAASCGEQWRHHGGQAGAVAPNPLRGQFWDQCKSGEKVGALGGGVAMMDKYCVQASTWKPAMSQQWWPKADWKLCW